MPKIGPLIFGYPMPTSALCVRNCSKTYANGFEALKNVSFDVDQGDFTVLLGLNGAGKTSLISMITGLSTITKGNISIFKHDVVSDNFNAKQLLGVMPQEINFNPFLTIMETLTFYGGYYGLRYDFIEKVSKPLLQKARLWKKKDELVSSLSGGMRRMVMLIRALVVQPKLVILDEPTANLDIEIREIIWGILRELKKNNVTVLLTTHNLVEAESLCNKVIIIHQGKLVFNDKIHDAITNLREQYFTIGLTDKSHDLTFLASNSYHFDEEKNLVVKVTKDRALDTLLSTLHQHGVAYSTVAPTQNQLQQILKMALYNDS